MMASRVKGDFPFCKVRVAVRKGILEIMYEAYAYDMLHFYSILNNR